MDGDKTIPRPLRYTLQSVNADLLCLNREDFPRSLSRIPAPRNSDRCPLQYLISVPYLQVLPPFHRGYL